MADQSGRIQVDAIVSDALDTALKGMSTDLRNVINSINAVTKSASANENTFNSLNRTLRAGESANTSYARSVARLSKDQAVLAAHFRSVRSAADALERQMKSGSNNIAGYDAASQRLLNTLRQQEKAEKGLSKLVLKQDLQRQSASLTELANKYSQAGNRLSMSLTIPILGFARTAFSSYKRLEVETVRTRKLLSDSFTDITGVMNTLGKELDSITYKYGVSRELIQGIAGDFAELGLNSVDAIAGLADLTAATEKLGNVDIGESQEFIKSIYQTILRIKRDSGILTETPEDYAQVISEVTGQLAMFNLVENKTALSLKEIAKGFPEMGAAATSFGLSMTEATALLAPMVSSGFQLGAAANSVKVSLQRIVDMPKENQTMLTQLNMDLEDFNVQGGVGIQTIQKFADGFNKLKSTKGEQGTLEFFAKMFGVRQGSRMLIGFQNLAQFQEQLQANGTVERDLANLLETYVKKQTKNLAPEYSQIQIRKFEDLSKIVRLTQSKDKDIADAFTKGRDEFATYLAEKAKSGNDLLSKIQTESGRTMFIAAAGGGADSEAARKFRQEIEASLNTTEVKYQRAREMFKSIGRQLVPTFAQLLSAVNPILTAVTKILEKISPAGKMFISLGLVFLALLGPLMKMRGAFYQMKSSIVALKAYTPFSNWRKQLIPVSEELIRSNDLLFKLKGKLTQQGNNFFISATRKEFELLQKAMTLEATGGFFAKRKAENIKKRLGITDQTKADFSGLLPGMAESVQRSLEGQVAGTELIDAQRNILGQYAQVFTDAGGQITAKIMEESTAIGRGIAEEMLAVLAQFGFDPASVVRPTPPPKGNVKAGTGTPPPPGTPPGGGTPPATPPGGGTPPPPTKPAGGGGAALPPATLAPVTPPATTTPATSTGAKPAKQPRKSGPRTRILNPQELYDIAMNPLIDGLEKISVADLKEMLKLRGFSSSSFAGMNPKQLKKKLMDHFEANGAALVKSLADYLNDVAGKATNVVKPKKARGPSTKTGDASAQATTDVADAQEEVDTETVVDQGKSDTDAVKDNKKKSGKGSSKTKKASKKAADDVAEAQDDLNTRTVKKDTDRVLEEIKGTPYNPAEAATGFAETIKIRLKALEDALTPIRESLDLASVEKIDVPNIGLDGVISAWDVFQESLFGPLEKEKNQLKQAAQDLYPELQTVSAGLISETLASFKDIFRIPTQFFTALDEIYKQVPSMRELSTGKKSNAKTKQIEGKITEAETELKRVREKLIRNREKLSQEEVDAIETQMSDMQQAILILRGDLKTEQDKIKSSAQKALTRLNTKLRSAQAGPITTESINEIVQAFNEIAGLTKADFSEILDILIIQLKDSKKEIGQKIKGGTVSKEKGQAEIKGINFVIKELEKTKEVITNLSKNIDEQVGGRLTNITGRLSRIRNRLIGTVFPDYGSVSGGEVERVSTSEADQAFDDDFGSIGGLLDEIINNELESRQKLDENGVLKSVVFNEADKIKNLEQLNEDLIGVNAAIESAEKRLTTEVNKKPYSGQDKKIKILAGELENLIEQKQSLEEQLSGSLEEDFGRGGRSVLNQVKDIQDRIQSLKTQIEIAKQSVIDQNQKIANIKTNQETFIAESVAKQQIGLTEATAKAQQYAQENAQLIADKVAEMQIAREALYSATQEYTQQEVENDQELIRQLNIVEGKIKGTVRLLGTRRDGVHTEQLNKEYKQLLEERTRLEKEYAKTSDKRLGIQQKQQQVQMLEEEVRSMTAQATVPAPVSEEEMFARAKTEYATMLRQEEGVVTTLNTQIAGFSSELRFAIEKESGFLQRLKAALGSLSGILSISTPEGYEAEVNKFEQQRLEQIGITREAERIQKEIIRMVRSQDLGDLENPTEATIGDIRTQAALQLKSEKEINDKLNRSKREQGKRQSALESTTDVDEIAALQEEIDALEISISNNMTKLTTISQVKKNLAALARQLYNVEIFTNPNNKTLASVDIEEGIAPIANQVEAVQANLEAVVGQDLDKIFGTTFEDLRKLGFDISNVKGKILKEGKLRLTGTVFKNIAEKLGIILPPVFDELGDLLTQTDIVFKDAESAFTFVKGMLEKIEVGKSRKDTIGSNIEYGALQSLLKIDKIAKLLDLGSKNLLFGEIIPDDLKTKLSNLFKEASGKVIEARKKRSDAAQPEIKTAVASVSDNAQISISVMDEFEGHITDFFLNRLRMMKDFLFSNELLLAKQKIQSGKDTKSQSIAQKQSQKQTYLKEINELIRKGPEANKARIESLKESVRIINADIAKLEQAKEIHIAQIDKTIEDINNSLRDRVRGIRGVADMLRRRLGLKSISRRGGVPTSQDVGGVSIREALAAGQISEEQYIARKAPNEALFTRPRVITPEASAARKKILERIKQSLDNYKVADQHNKERIAGLIDKDIVDSRAIISDFMAEKDSIFGNMLLGFRIQMQAISDIPKELRTNFDNLRLQGFETAIQDAKGLLNRLLRAGFSEEEATKAAERYMSRIAAGLMEFHELIQVDFDAYFARLEQDSIAAIEADQSLIGAAFKYVNPLEFLNRSGIVEKLKSLSAAANPFMNTGDILDRNIIEHMLTILLEQFGKTGEEIKRFVEAFNSTLIGSRERLVAISKATVGDIQDEIPALIASFEKLGITLQEALSDPARTMALIKDSTDFKNIAKKDDLVELFRTLILFARDAADKTVEQVIEQTIGRVRVSSSKAGGGGTPAGTPSFFNALSKVAGNEESKSFIESNLTLDLLKEIQITPEELKNLLNVKQLQYLAQAIGGLTRQQSGKTKDEVISNVIKLIKDVQDGVITELHAVSRPSDGSKGKAREAAKETKKKIKEEEKKIAEEAKAAVEDAKTTTTPSKTTLQRVMEHPMLVESPIESMKKIINMKNRLLIPLAKQDRASLLYLKELVENISEDGTFIDLLLEKYGINLSEFIVQIRAEIEKTVQEDRVKTKKVISDYRSQMHGPFLSEIPRPSFGSIAEQRAANAEKYSSRGVSLEKSSLTPLVSELNTAISEPITEVKTNIDKLIQSIIWLMGNVQRMTKDQLFDMIMMLGNTSIELSSAFESMGMPIESMMETITQEMERVGRESGVVISQKFNRWFDFILQSVKTSAIDEANILALQPGGILSSNTVAKGVPAVTPVATPNAIVSGIETDIVELEGFLAKGFRGDLAHMVSVIQNVTGDIDTMTLDQLRRLSEVIDEMLGDPMAYTTYNKIVGEELLDFFTTIEKAIQKFNVMAHDAAATSVGPAIAKTFDDIVLDIKNVGTGRFNGDLADFVMGFRDLVVNLNNLTEDQLLKLQNEIKPILNDPTVITKFTDQFGIDLEFIFEEIENALAKLKTTAHTAATSATASATKTPAGSGVGAGGGSGNKPPAGGPPAGGPQPANNPIPPQAAKASLTLREKLMAVAVGGFKVATVLGRVQLAIITTAIRLLPFGSLMLSAGTAIFKVVTGIPNFVKNIWNIGKASKQASTGLLGFIKALGQQIKQTGLGQTVISKATNIGKSVVGGMSGSMKGQLGMGLGQAINMSTMNMGMGGMIFGNVLENFVRGIQSIPVVGGPAVAIISALAAGIAIIVKTVKGMKDSESTVKNFKKAWESIKRIAIALVKPFEDFFAAIFGGTSKTTTGVEKARGTLERLSEWVANTTEKIANWVEKSAAPAIRKFLQVILAAINVIQPFIGAFFAWIGAKIDATNAKKVLIDVQAKKPKEGDFLRKLPRAEQADIEKNTEYATYETELARAVEQTKVTTEKLKKAWQNFKDNFHKMTRVLGILFEGFLMSTLWNIVTWLDLILVNGIEQVFILIVNIVRWTLKVVLNIFKLFVKGFVNLFTGIPKILATAMGKVIEWAGKLANLISKIPKMGWLKGVAKNIEDFGKDMSGTQINWFDNVLHGIDKGAGAVSDAIDVAADWINAKIGSLSNGVTKGNNKMQDKIRKDTGKKIKELFKDIMPEGIGEGLGKSLFDMVKQMFKNPAAADAAGEALKDTLNAIKDAKVKAKIEFDNSALDAVSGKLGEAVNKIKDELTQQLTEQKDASLKVFDDQIEAINALADAESQLTATEEYESNRRKMIRDNELRRQNSSKERALAIYEGRVDDARNIDLQEIKDTQDFNDQLTNLDSGRQKDLQSINRNNAIAVIKAQREAASKQFDQAIKDFENYATKLLQNGTFTEEQFKDQVGKMLTQAGITSTGIQTKFEELFTQLPSKIQTGMDPITAEAGFFTVGLEKLRTIASTKFGLSTGVADPNSILGITAGMLGGMGSSITNAFVAGGPIQKAYGVGLDAVNTYVKNKTTGTGPETTESIFKQAIIDAADKMVAEANSKKPAVAAAASALVTAINSELVKIQKDAIAKAVAEAAANGIAQMKRDIQTAKDTAASATDEQDPPKFAYWFRPAGGKVGDWKLIPASSTAQYAKNPSYEFAQTRNGKPPTYFKGGMMPYAKGGPTFGPMNLGIPAILHGGEFVIRKNAVDKYGLEMLSQINKGIYAPEMPKFNIPMANYTKIANAGTQSQVSSSESTHNYNFYVDNFIGETEWFNSMMKEYNMKVVPANQKQAGIESRVIKTYNGINRGM